MIPFIGPVLTKNTLEYALFQEKYGFCPFFLLREIIELYFK